MTLIQVQPTVLGNLQTQGSDWSLLDIHGRGYQWRCLLDSLTCFQREVRRICVNCLHCRHCEFSLLRNGLCILLSQLRLQVMDMLVVIAALILNPIARRKRAAQASESAQMVEAPPTSASDTGGSNSTGKSDLESGVGPAAGRNRLKFAAPART